MASRERCCITSRSTTATPSASSRSTSPRVSLSGWLVCCVPYCSVSHACNSCIPSVLLCGAERATTLCGCNDITLRPLAGELVGMYWDGAHEHVVSIDYTTGATTEIAQPDIASI